MLSDFTGADKVYIACGYTDLRKGIDGLAHLVQQQFELDPCVIHRMERYAALLRKCCPGECLSLEKSSQIHRCCGPLRFDLHF